MGGLRQKRRPAGGRAQAGGDLTWLGREPAIAAEPTDETATADTAPAAAPAGPTSDPAAVDDDADTAPVVLPEPVRIRVVSLAADQLGELPYDDVPASLRPHARFTPSRRARLAAGPIAAALESNPTFRSRVADGVQERTTDLAAAVAAGVPPPAAAPEEVGALAYLLRPPGWRGLLAAASDALTAASAAAASASSTATVTRLQEQLAALRGTARAEAERLRGEVAAARAEVDELRRQLRVWSEQARLAERAATAAKEQAAAERAAAASAVAGAAAANRRLSDRLADAEAAAGVARRAARADRSVDEMRLRLLLDTVVDAASGLRRELALPASTIRPADLVATGTGTVPGRGGEAPEEPARGLAEDDPVRLDALLSVPQTHLVVDGYNVTKLGYGALPLEAQRNRLVSGLAGLAAQTGVEVTCVFDGAERPAIAGAVPRNVRVAFSRPGQSADELIRQLVRAEPPGRPVVAVSSDREVADGVRRAGARSVPSAALVRRLDRG